jgi:hypothetical protein
MSTELRFISLNGVSLVEKHSVNLHEPVTLLNASASRMLERRKNTDRRNSIRFENNRRMAYESARDAWASERNR